MNPFLSAILKNLKGSCHYLKNLKGSCHYLCGKFPVSLLLAPRLKQRRSGREKIVVSLHPLSGQRFLYNLKGGRVLRNVWRGKQIRETTASKSSTPERILISTRKK